MAARCAAGRLDSVDVVTTIYLLRLRHQLEYVRRREPFQLMAETVALAVKGRTNPEWIIGNEVNKLLECIAQWQPAQRRPWPGRSQHALAFMQDNQAKLEALAEERANLLLADHKRVREARAMWDQYSNTNLSAGRCDRCVYVLLPDAL